MHATASGHGSQVDLHLEADLCKGCGLCIHLCPRHVLHRSEHLNRRGFHPAVYDGDGCTGCAICYATCPEPGGIRVRRG